MSEQRFKLDSDDENEPSEFFTDYGDFWEDGTPKTYWFDDYEDFEDIVGLLNEQQANINKLKSDIEETEISIKLFEDDIATKDKKIDEQQSTIEQLRQSRDYWCKSAKLHSKYFNCLEKAIERAYEEKPNPTDEDINRIYAELEKEIDDD